MGNALACWGPALTSPPATPRMCTTGYDWSSLGGGHNCNDDSQMELQAVVWNVNYAGTEGSCSSSSSTHANAPSGCP